MKKNQLEREMTDTVTRLDRIMESVDIYRLCLRPDDRSKSKYLSDLYKKADMLTRKLKELQRWL